MYVAGKCKRISHHLGMCAFVAILGRNEVSQGTITERLLHNAYSRNIDLNITNKPLLGSIATPCLHLHSDTGFTLWQ